MCPFSAAMCRIGTFNGNTSRYTPFTEPNEFTGQDEYAVNARSVLQWYVWASDNNPDFEVIRARYELPTVAEVREALA
jgi:hypothetical protein